MSDVVSFNLLFVKFVLVLIYLKLKFVGLFAKVKVKVQVL